MGVFVVVWRWREELFWLPRYNTVYGVGMVGARSLEDVCDTSFTATITVLY